MIQSRYNYIYEVNDTTYWFNGITFGCFKLPAGLGKKVAAMLEQPQDLEAQVPRLYAQLVEKGFLVDDDKDELELIRSKNRQAVDAKDYLLVVLPTLDCNFKCWYCIQSHVPSQMSLEMMERIKRHIDYMIDKEQICSLHFSWFGGEPFMYLDEVVAPVSRYAMGRCRQAGIPFVNTATTNAYYLTSDRIPLLKELQFSNFQITLDGVPQEHDKVKFQEGCPSAFAHVLTNVNAMLSAMENLTILLRVNYTDRNLDVGIIEHVNRFITKGVRSRIVILPKKVWQENADRQRVTALDECRRLAKETGYQVMGYDLIESFTPCYVSKRYYNAITYAGKVFKCTAISGLHDADSPGWLKEDGSIGWKEDTDSLPCMKYFECERCLKCKHLPICMGNCPGAANNDSCKIEQHDLSVKDKIIQYVETYCAK